MVCLTGDCMKSTVGLRKRIFLRKIIVGVTLGLAVLITVFSGILYFCIESLVVRIESESNKNLMAQVQYNVRFIGDTIKNTCEHLYLSSDVEYIMNFGSSDSDFEEGMIRMNMVWKAVKDSNPFIHSIFIYNNNTRQFYSTYGGMLYQDASLEEYLKGRDSIPRMVPVFRKFKGESRTIETNEDVISYFIYDTYDKNSGMKNGIVVNVKQQWLLDNLNEVNLNRSSKDARLFLMDSNGEFVTLGDDKQFLAQVKKDYTAYMDKMREGKADSSFTTEFNREKYLVSFYQLDNAAITVFKTMPYRNIQAYVFQLQKVMMVMFIVFLAVAVLESLIISRKIYNPFDSMFAQIRSRSGKISGNMDDRDEISFLRTIYDRHAEMLETYGNENRSNSSIVKAYLLKNLLTDGSYNTEEAVKVLKFNNISFDTNACYAVGLIKIDRYEEMMQGWRGKDRDLIKFAILNISCEIIGSRYDNEGVDVGEDFVCLILCIKESERFKEIFTSLARQTQDSLLQYYGVSVTIAVSGIAGGLNDLPRAYGEAFKLSYYRYVLGRGAVIFPEQAAGNGGEASLQAIDKTEKKILDALMAGDRQKVERTLQTFFEQLSLMNYESIIISQFQLLRTLNQGVAEINRNRLEIVHVNFHELYHFPSHIETMEDFCRKLLELLQDLLDRDRVKMVESRHAMLIGAVTEMIDKNYSQSSLCLDEISLNMNISSRQLSRIFKSGTGRTVPEQINEVRLTRAAELLAYSDLSVGEVAAKVGIESETYFYSLFKRKYGTTPKEYSAIRPLKKEGMS